MGQKVQDIKNLPSGGFIIIVEKPFCNGLGNKIHQYDLYHCAEQKDLLDWIMDNNSLTYKVFQNHLVQTEVILKLTY